jgi:O-antigen/teichoic acid export membrane protein
VSFIYTYYRILRSISPDFTNLKVRINEIRHVNRTYGFHVYVGSLCAVGASSLTGVLISYFDVNNIGVGYFSLGMSLCTPLSLVPNILATAYFKDFAKSNKISNRVFATTAIFSLSGILLVWLIAKPFVMLLYGPSYLPAVNISYLLAIGFSLYGISDLLNKFLGAHGQGVALRNSSFLVGAFLLFSNVYFIQSFHELGAAYSKILAGIVYFCCMFLYYRSYVRKISHTML